MATCETPATRWAHGRPRWSARAPHGPLLAGQRGGSTRGLRRCSDECGGGGVDDAERDARERRRALRRRVTDDGASSRSEGEGDDASGRTDPVPAASQEAAPLGVCERAVRRTASGKVQTVRRRARFRFVDDEAEELVDGSGDSDEDEDAAAIRWRAAMQAASWTQQQVSAVRRAPPQHRTHGVPCRPPARERQGGGIGRCREQRQGEPRGHGGRVQALAVSLRPGRPLQVAVGGRPARRTSGFAAGMSGYVAAAEARHARARVQLSRPPLSLAARPLTPDHDKRHQQRARPRRASDFNGSRWRPPRRSRPRSDRNGSPPPGASVQPALT